MEVSDGPMSGDTTPDFFIDCYNYTRRNLQDLKSATNLAYDWGVNIYTLGIWRDVRIEASGPTRIEWLQIQTKLNEDHRQARVRVRIETDSQMPVRGKAFCHVIGHGFEKEIQVESQLESGRGVIEMEVPIDQPALWWPNGQGEQPLYGLEIALQDTASGETLHTRKTRFGVREVRWQQTEGAPADFINPYSLVVNGRPIRMMGSDVIPPDLLFGRMASRTRRLVQLAKEAGMNTLRIWGGGVTLTENFYDAADELGILLSQEFPLANSLPETGAIFLLNLESDITSVMKELRNHCSIVEWVGGNEMLWQQGTDHPALHVLEKVCAANDDRVFRATDPMQGSLHGPWWYQPRSHYEHYNSILESLSVPHPDLGPQTINAMRYGEFGTQSPANLEVFQREIPPSSQWPLDDITDPILCRKNVFQAAFTPLDWLIKPVIETLFGPLDNLEELIEVGQFVAAEGLRYAYDELRRKGRRIGGITSWDFNEPWPNGAGSYLVDYDGRTLMKFDFAKQALAPVSLTLRYNSILYDPSVGIKATLWVTSDAGEDSTRVVWEWLARDRRGEVIDRGTGSSSVYAGEARQLVEVNIKPPIRTALGPLFVELKLTGDDGKTLAERFHVFGADNVHVWPLEGLLRNTGLDQDDDALIDSKPEVVRVLWIHDVSEGWYEDIAHSLRHFGIMSNHIVGTAKEFEKLIPDARTLMENFDVIWFGSRDYRNAETLAHRLGEKSLEIVAAAVREGVGFGIEGGWTGFARAGLEGTPLADAVPLILTDSDSEKRGKRGAMTVAAISHPIVAGKLMASIPNVSGYNVVVAKKDSDIVLKTDNGDPLLTTNLFGKGRVLAFASGIVGSAAWLNSPMTAGYQGERLDWGWSLQAWSGFPFFMGRLLHWLSGAQDASISAMDYPQPAGRTARPVLRTTLTARTRWMTVNGDIETLIIEVINTGKMTALMCEPHPLLEYRTDITISDNHGFIAPGVSRRITITAPHLPAAKLTLGQIGWKISCWNADDVFIQSDETVLLYMGRKDATCRGYAQMGASGPKDSSNRDKGITTLHGRNPDCAAVPWLLSDAYGSTRTVRFLFTASRASDRSVGLRIHTADQDSEYGAQIEVNLNGQKLAGHVGPGLGIQISDCPHLAFPESAEWHFPAGSLKAGENILEVRVSGKGWFTWDSLDLRHG